MRNNESIRGLFTRHINKEYESIAKTKFKRQIGENSPTKSTISNSVLRNNRTEHFQRPREIKS